MKLSIFGRHPIPQGGFNGVMSLFEAIEFSRLGYDTTLLLPFLDHASFEDFLKQHKLASLNELSRFDGHFAIVPVFPDGENFEPCDVLVYQSYFPDDWHNFGALCRKKARIMTKNFPKFVPSPQHAFAPGVVGQFKQFDLVACALREDVAFLSSNLAFASEFGGRFIYSPRGASPQLLHPGYKPGLVPTIGLDVPNTPDMTAIQHYFEPIERLKHDYPDLRVLSIGREIPVPGAVKIPFGRFDRIFDRFFNQIHAYCTINYEHSPQHTQAEVQRQSADWRRKAIYEVQNIESQMSGACLIGHRDNLIAELYEPGLTGFNFAAFDNPTEIYRVLKYALDHRGSINAGARRFAVANFAWSHCIRLWSDGIQALDAKMTPPSTGASKPVAMPPAPALQDLTRSQELDLLIKLGQKYKWAKDAERSKLEHGGVNLVRTDFYSDTPTLADIDASFEYAGWTSVANAVATFDDESVFDTQSILATARDLVPFTENFDPPRDMVDGKFYWKNTQFSGTDAVLLYGIIHRDRPKTIIEIGSGFSSHVAHQALTEVGEGRLICIDPEPRTDISQLKDIEVVTAPIQTMNRNFFTDNLQPGDIVFLRRFTHRENRQRHRLFLSKNITLFASRRDCARS